MSLMGPGGSSESRVIRLAPESLAASPRQVTRYAGGSRYQPDGTGQSLVQAALVSAGRLITPALVYSVHPVASRSPDGSLRLNNGLSVNLPFNEPDSDTGYLAAIVCTLGPGLGEACRQLGRQRNFLEALFLDAAGTALLEGLGEHTYDLLGAQAQTDGFFAGCRFAPGYGSMPMSEQSLLFRLVDAGAIGVKLNSHLVMRPYKSLSFFSILNRERSSARKVYKCQACSLKDCRFRVHPGDKSGDCSPPSG